MLKAPAPLPQGSTVAITACSQGLSDRDLALVDSLVSILQEWGLRVWVTPRLKDIPQSSHPRALRAQDLMEAFTRPEVSAIFDVSGGDAANEVLGLLDFEQIKTNPKPFFGLSDISVLLNAFLKSGTIPVWHFQPLNLVGPYGEGLQELFYDHFISGEGKGFIPGIEMLRGSRLQGPLVGGNIRCFLKLAGTPFWPKVKGCVLLLESYGGDGPLLSSLLAQLELLGVFKQIKGILLGTFTQWEKKEGQPTMEALTLEWTKPWNLPVGKTHQLGHGRDALPVALGIDISWFPQVMD